MSKPDLEDPIEEDGGFLEDFFDEDLFEEMAALEDDLEEEPE